MRNNNKHLGGLMDLVSIIDQPLLVEKHSELVM